MTLTVRRDTPGILKAPDHHELPVLGGAAQLRETAAGEHLEADPVLGSHARPDAYAGPVGLLEQRRERLRDRPVAAGVLHEAEADLGLRDLVRPGRRSPEEPDRADDEPVGAADDVPGSPG